MDTDRHWKKIAGAAVFALFYYLTARCGLIFSITGANVSPPWPASGVALAGLLLLGREFWPGIWIGSFTASLLELNALQPQLSFRSVGVAGLLATISALT